MHCRSKYKFYIYKSPPRVRSVGAILLQKVCFWQILLPWTSEEEKTFCKLCKPLFCIETVAILLFFYYYLFLKWKILSEMWILPFHTMSQITFILHRCGYVWNSISTVCCHSTGKIMIIITKNPLKCLPLPFLCACSSAAPQDIILWPFQNQSAFRSKSFMGNHWGTFWFWAAIPQGIVSVGDAELYFHPPQTRLFSTNLLSLP